MRLRHSELHSEDADRDGSHNPHKKKKKVKLRALSEMILIQAGTST